MADKAYLGAAVESGRLRYLSVSAIQKFDRTEPAGCPRAWYYRYVERRKEPETEALRLGTQVATELETYLKTGQDALSPIARAGKFLLPAPGPDLEVEQPLGDIGQALKLADAGDYAEACRVAGLSAGGVPMMGAADCRHFRGEYVCEEGFLRADTATVEIIDHKTTSRILDQQTKSGKVYQGYAKTAAQVAKATQMLGYAIHAIRRTKAEKVRLSHIYYQTKGATYAEKRTAVIDADAALKAWTRIDAIATEIKHVARESDPGKVPTNLTACRAFGRPCAFAEICPGTSPVLTPTPEKGPTMNLFNSIKRTASVPAPAPTPAFPAPQPQPAQADADARRQAELARLEAEDMAAGLGAINPPDAPSITPDDAANPLTMEVIAAINDPELKARAEAHAKAAAPKPEKKPTKKAEAAPTLFDPPGEGGQVPTIYLDCAVMGQPQPRPLSDYYDPIVSAILTDAREADLRSAQEGYLSHGKWRGVLAVAVKNRPLPAGEYTASTHDEIEMAIVHSLRARIVRGLR